ncbi:MAG: hypothetical protein ACXWC9_01880 [Pseudobdellovibrionaceae bacterium]
MGHETLDRAAIEKALQRSPSGGNAKPFIWAWFENTLEIECRPDSGLHYLNRNQHTTWLALGLLIESAHVTARSLGWQMLASISPNGVKANLSFSRDPKLQVSEKEWFQLLKRRTFRGPFVPSQAPKTLADSATVHLATLDSITESFKKYLISADTYLWAQKEATAHFLKEIRFFDKRIEPRGIRSQDLGVGFLDQLMLYCFRLAPGLLSKIATTPILNFTFQMASQQSLRNAHFILITSPTLDSQGLLQAGRDSMRAWLQMEEQGFSIQPYSIPAINLVDASKGVLPADTLEKFRTLFSITGPKVLQEQFQLAASQKPVWLLRVGRPKG